MFGISYGELFLIIGATAALVGPKDLPIIARTAGRLAGRAIGYVQLARRQLINVMQQSQARQVQKELQDAMQQIKAIRYEMRCVSLINPGPLTRKLTDYPLEPTSNHSDDSSSKKFEEHKPIEGAVMHYSLKPSGSIHLYSQATAYAGLAESEVVKSSSLKNSSYMENFLSVLTEDAGMPPNYKKNVKGSDNLLEAFFFNQR